MKQLGKGLFFGVLGFLFLGAAANLNAKTWKVYPWMTRTAIQLVIDQGKDNDKIHFYAGTYDFSDTPFSSKPFSGGALIVTDKSLSFMADNGTILVGAPSILDPDSGIGQSGIIAFNVMNSVAKDISFKGFTFSEFLMAIDSGIEISYDPVTGDVMAPSCRDFTVQDCTFDNIDRQAIAANGVQRNIKILNNEISWSLRIGIFLDWYWVGDRLGSQPKSGSITIANNDICARVECLYINRGNKISIKKNSFDASGSDTTSWGSDIREANAAAIANNDFTNLNVGLVLIGEEVVDGGSEYFYPVTKCNITKNIFIVEGGIYLGGEACYANKITNNTIALGGTGAWGINPDGGYNDIFTNNKFFGGGDVAVAVTGYDNTALGIAVTSHNEYFKGNSVKNFTSTGSDYYMSSYSHDNTAIGICPEHATYYDEGVNNHFQCIDSSVASAAAFMKDFELPKRSHSDRKPLTK